MKNNAPKPLRGLLLLLGLCPFAAPLLLGIHRVLTESWAFLDWIVLSPMSTGPPASRGWP